MNYKTLFGSALRTEVLGWFFAQTDESFSVRQLAAILKRDPTNLSRELGRLESLGILKYSRTGNLKQYRVNKDLSFYQELKGLVSKTMGFEGRLKSALARVKGLVAAFIYGSFAAGNERTESDIDLFLVGRTDLSELDAILAEVERRLGRTINYIRYESNELSAKIRAGDGFITDVLKSKKVWLLGSEDELKKV